MADSKRVHVIDSTQHLVDVYFGVHGGGRVQAHELKEVLVVGFHGDVEVLVLDLVSDEGGIDFDDEWIIEHFSYIQFSRFVFFVLLHSLQGDHLP